MVNQLSQQSNHDGKYGDAVAVALQDDRACAPALWELELSNGLRTACLRQRLPAQVVSLPIDVDRQAVPAAELLALALRFGLSTCDATYLELALRLQLPVATADGPLREAAVASGVGLFDPKRAGTVAKRR
jgi:predicted nucleic acid-binding protein